jgi:branched-chain amino acid transport system ATP-binding protein
MANEPLLKVEKVSVKFHGVHALNQASIELFPKEIVALMGPNGAGKSTLLKSIFGLVKAEEGEVFVKSEHIQPTPERLIQRGVNFVPQGKKIFPSLTVGENLEVGGLILHDKKKLKERISNIFDTFPMLTEKRKESSGKLSGGQQQTLAMARALILQPEVLLVDEPTIGLSPKMVKEVFEQMKKINEQFGTTILVVEHNLKSLASMVNRAYLLEKGKIVASGCMKEIVKSDIMQKAFLGKEIE